MGNCRSGDVSRLNFKDTINGHLYAYITVEIIKRKGYTHSTFFEKISTRTKKIGSVIQKALAQELIRFEDEHGLVTISEVQVFPDLSEAHVYICAQRSSKRLIEKLNARAGILKKEISKNLMQRRTPKLLFRLDLGRIAANKIDDLLNQ